MFVRQLPKALDLWVWYAKRRSLSYRTQSATIWVRRSARVVPSSIREISDMDYKETLNLPQTAFPMKANLSKREPEILAKWDSMKLYPQLREHEIGRASCRERV